MSLTVLGHILVTERYRQRSARGAGLSVPYLLERQVDPTQNPLLVTNSRAGFTLTHRNQEGLGRYGICSCKIDEEPKMIRALFETISRISHSSGWANRFASIPDALKTMRESPFPPHGIILPQALVNDITKEPRMPPHLGDLEGMKVFSSDLPLGAALLVTAPPALGVYTRIGDYLGLQLFNVRQTLAVVSSNGVVG